MITSCFSCNICPHSHNPCPAMRIRGYFQRYALYKSTFYLLTYLHVVIDVSALGGGAGFSSDPSQNTAQ